MTTNRKAIDTFSAADYLHIAKTQSTEFAIMTMNKDLFVVGDLNPIRDILNDYVANGNENTRLDYAKRIEDYTANNDVFAQVNGNIEISDAQRCINVIRRAEELGKLDNRLILAVNNDIIRILTEHEIAVSTQDPICENIKKLQLICDLGNVDEDDFKELFSDIFYGAFKDYVGLKPDYICDVDSDWMDPVNEGNEMFIDASGWEWSFNVQRDGDIYYMAADGSITTYWQDALPWCENGFYICDKSVDSFGDIVLIIAMCH